METSASGRMETVICILMLLEVDINRNFPTGWSSRMVDRQTNPGESPIDQPISKCIEEQVDKKRPDVYLDIHTGEFSIYHEPGVNKKKEQTILKWLKGEMCKNCKIRETEP